MEEFSARGLKREAGGGSISISIRRCYADNENATVVTDSGKETTKSDINFRRRIEKVPMLLRNNANNKGEYDPNVVSLGPYHHGKPELQFVEQFKPMVARLFVSDSGKAMDEFYQKVLLMVDDTRSYYVEGSTDTYSDEKLTEMMLLDGCFILGMIESVSGQKRGRKSKYNDVLTRLGFLVWHSITADMVFLLENQIPFQVLELLMNLKFEDDEGMKMINEFLESPVSSGLQFQSKSEVKASKYEKPPLHLLQLYRTKLLFGPCGDQVSQSNGNLKTQKGTQKDKFRGKRGLNFKDYIQSFRSITELKAKGIYFSPSNSRSLNAIKFKPCYFYGQLELRPFFVTPKTKIMLSNMIAYGLCPDNPNNLEMTSYIGFLKSLIDHPDDVKELRSNHILFNMLGSNQEVANVFKETTTFGAEDLQIYEEVRQSIQDHYNSKAKTWMAEFIHNHFSSPWTVIAFVAAASVVVLSFFQTYFTVFPRSGN